MSKLMGKLSHKVLMKLKNSGAIMPMALEELANNLYLGAMVKVREALLVEKKGFNWERLWFYNEEMARKDAEAMFSERHQLVDHLHATGLHSKYIPLTGEEAERLLFVDRASTATNKCSEVLECFKYHDEVLVDPDTGYYVQWVLQNALKIKETIAERGNL